MIGALTVLVVQLSTLNSQLSTGASQQPSVIVQPAAGQFRPNPTWAKVDLGTLDALADTPFLRRSFKIKNEGTEEVILGPPQLSCGCTQALIGGKPIDGFKLAAGAEAEITADLEFNKLKPGIFDKYVWIYTKSHVQPILTFELGGFIKPSVVIEPPIVRFDRVRPKDAQPVAVRVLLDKRLAELFSDAALACSLPDVVIKPEGAGPLGERMELKYSVSLSPTARIGMVNGTLALNSPKMSLLTTEQSLPLTKRYAQLTGTVATVVGQVLGSFNASPATIVFGHLLAGKPATRQIAIVSDTPMDPAKLKIATASRFLEAKLVETKPAARLSLNVSFKDDAPGGAYDTQVILSNQAGEQLVIPVLAYITR